MSVGLDLLVRWRDKPEEVVHVDGSDFVHYETLTDEPSFPLLGLDRMEYAYRLAWAGMRRQGMFDGGFDEFYGAAAMVQVAPDGDPTRPAGTPPEG